MSLQASASYRIPQQHLFSSHFAFPLRSRQGCRHLKMTQHSILCSDCLFRDFIKGHGGKQGGTRVLAGFYPSGKPWYVAHTGVMQSLHTNENLLFKNFQDFLIQRKHAEENRDSSLSPLGYPLLRFLVPVAYGPYGKKEDCLTSLNICHRNLQQENRGQFHWLQEVIYLLAKSLSIKRSGKEMLKCNDAVRKFKSWLSQLKEGVGTP